MDAAPELSLAQLRQGLLSAYTHLPSEIEFNAINAVAALPGQSNDCFGWDAWDNLLTLSQETLDYTVRKEGAFATQGLDGPEHHRTNLLLAGLHETNLGGELQHCLDNTTAILLFDKLSPDVQNEVAVDPAHFNYFTSDRPFYATFFQKLIENSLNKDTRYHGPDSYIKTMRALKLAAVNWDLLADKTKTKISGLPPRDQSSFFPITQDSFVNLIYTVQNAQWDGIKTNYDYYKPSPLTSPEPLTFDEFSKNIPPKQTPQQISAELTGLIRQGRAERAALVSASSKPVNQPSPCQPTQA